MYIAQILHWAWNVTWMLTLQVDGQVAIIQIQGAVLSRTGFVISYAGCPIFWHSKLQTEIVLSTTEAEYIALSQAMRDVLPFLNLMKEIREVVPLQQNDPKLFCKVWEDNRSCIKVAESPKFTPRTKHIALKYHHFRQFVSNGTVVIKPIDTKEQTADTH